MGGVAIGRDLSRVWIRDPLGLPMGLLSRQVAMFLIREETPSSLPVIGQAFGRDHTTALHSIDKIQNEMQESTRLADDGMPINNLRLLLGQASIETTLLYIGKALTKSAASDAASRSVRVMPFAATAVAEED